MGLSSAGVAGLKPGVIDNAAARPSSPFEGQLVYEKDIDMLAIWNGTEWGYIYSSSGNLLHNGAMQVTQRSAVGTAVTGITTDGYYTADRWNMIINTLGTWSQTTNNDAPTGSGFRNSFRMACTTADASPAAGDYLMVRQKIEGQNLQAIRKGTASAQTVTLSFWVKAFQTGTFIVELEDVDNSRSVSKSYTVNASNTWEYKTITFPADTTGAFDNDANASLVLLFWLGAGSTYTSGTLQTTWGTQVAANRAVGVSNLASSTSNNWQMTGAQLTVGSVATPFEFKSYGDDLFTCQRYYYQLPSAMYIIATRFSSNSYASRVLFPTTLRGTAPTVTVYAGASATGTVNKFEGYSVSASVGEVTMSLDQIWADGFNPSRSGDSTLIMFYGSYKVTADL